MPDRDDYEHADERDPEAPQDCDLVNGEAPLATACPECGREMSDDAEMCPGCGCWVRTQNAQANRTPNIVLFGIALLLIGLILLWLTM